MPFSSVDPANLDGEELDRWYRRSPDEIERARQAAAQHAYDRFFGQSADGGPSRSARSPVATAPPSIGQAWP
jgi:hypothetical protein